MKKQYAVVAGVAGSASLLAVNANAALDAGVSTAFTAIGTDITTLAGFAWTALLLGLGISIAMKLTKRFGNKI